MSEDSSFWDQLKERKVVRVAVLYGAVAWAGLEAADLLTGVLDLPDWTTQLVLASAQRSRRSSSRSASS